MSLYLLPRESNNLLIQPGIKRGGRKSQMLAFLKSFFFKCFSLRFLSFYRSLKFFSAFFRSLLVLYCFVCFLFSGLLAYYFYGSALNVGYHWLLTHIFPVVGRRPSPEIRIPAYWVGRRKRGRNIPNICRFLHYHAIRRGEFIQILRHKGWQRGENEEFK